MLENSEVTVASVGEEETNLTAQQVNNVKKKFASLMGQLGAIRRVEQLAAQVHSRHQAGQNLRQQSENHQSESSIMTDISMKQILEGSASSSRIKSSQNTFGDTRAERPSARATTSPLLPVKPEVMPPAVLGSGWLVGKTKTDAD